MSRHFMIVIEEKGQFEVGLADGIWPWVHHATCPTAEAADRVCTLLAMHYRVPARTVAERSSLLRGTDR